MIQINERPRRNRTSQAIRSLVRETDLSPRNFVLPIFLLEGEKVSEPIEAMPGCNRLSVDLAVELSQTAYELGIPAIAIFPAIAESIKDSEASESVNPDGLNQRAIRAIKAAVPQLVIFSDVAMDPYSSDGHDGIVKDGKILNDESLSILAKMAVSQAQAGADFVSPSDMMDGRVAYIRKALDENGFKETGILSYCAKYASNFYGPFRNALDSAPKAGDKKTYQMDFANIREAGREARLDIAEGADILMVKPALCYLDVIAKLRASSDLPIAAYNVSGEYAMIKAAAEKGMLVEEQAVIELLTSIKRAGADIIFSYHAIDAARTLRSSH